MSQLRSEPLHHALTMADVPEVFAEHTRLPATERPAVLDLTDVERADSSALAMLLALKADATAASRTFSAINPPANLITLAELMGVSALLDWPGSIDASSENKDENDESEQ